MYMSSKLRYNQGDEFDKRTNKFKLNARMTGRQMRYGFIRYAFITNLQSKAHTDRHRSITNHEIN